MINVDPSEPAFPVTDLTGDVPTGMSVRTYLAAMAMQGSLSSDIALQAVAYMVRKENRSSATIIASLAVEQADALIRELNKESK